MSRLGANVEGSHPPKRAPSFAYDPPHPPFFFCWSIFSLMPSLCDLLRYSFVIYSFPRVDQQPDFDGLPRAVNLSLTALPAHPSSRSRNFYPLRCADVSAVPLASICLRCR